MGMASYLKFENLLQENVLRNQILISFWKGQVLSRSTNLKVNNRSCVILISQVLCEVSYGGREDVNLAVAAAKVWTEAAVHRCSKK